MRINEKISDLSFRKMGVLTAFALAALLVVMSFIDQGVDYTVDIIALKNHYGIFPLLFCTGAIGLVIQALCLKTAIESHKIYTFISLLVLGYISYLFLSNYEILYQYMDLNQSITDYENQLIPATQVIDGTALIKETSDILYNASIYMIMYGVVQFIIGLIPDAWMMSISEKISNKENISSKNESIELEEPIIEEVKKKDKKVCKKAFLLNQNDGNKVEVKEELSVGKAETCDYVIEDIYLNPLHAKIIKREGNYLLIDCETINKTYLNDEELIKYKEYVLNSGDYIVMADVEFKFVIEEITEESL